MTDLDVISTLILGSVGTLGALLCVTQERKYKKAKRLLASSQEFDLNSPETVVNLIKSDKKKRRLYVSGNVKSIDSTKIVYTETRPREFSYLKGRLVDIPSSRTIASSKFIISDKKEQIEVSPYQETLSFGIKRKSRKYTGFMNYLRYGLLIAVGGNRLPFKFFDVNYSLSEGDYITAFGTVCYNIRTGKVEMNKAKYLLKGSTKDLVNYLSGNVKTKWWTTIILEAITLGILTYTCYKIFKIITAFRKAQDENEQKPNMILVNDINCMICRKGFRTIRYMNCGDLVVCSECDERENFTHCPKCHQLIEERKRIYLA